MDCVVCERASHRELGRVQRLGHRLPDGYSLIVPRRHESDFPARRSAEQAAVWALVPDVCHHIGARHRPDGSHMGVNVGQTPTPPPLWSEEAGRRTGGRVL